MAGMTVGQYKMKRDPTPQGLKFINSRAREQLFGGAKRGSKTVTLGQKIILLSYMFPGNRGLLARNDFTDLRDTTLHEFWQTVPDELLDRAYGNGTGNNKGEREIRLKTLNPRVSSSILYRGLGNQSEKDIDKIKSLNLGWLAIDEASEIYLPTYLMLNAQLTWILPDGTRPPYMSMLTSNPEPGWVKDRFIDIPADQLAALGREFIPALPRDNPHLPPGWEVEMRYGNDPEWVEKYLDGSWDVVEGTVFDKLDPIMHNILPEWVPVILQFKPDLILSIDHGETGVIAATVNAVDSGNNHYVLDEYHEKDKLISEACKRICEMIELYIPPEINDWRSMVKYCLIDPSTSQRTLESGNKKQAVADAYRLGGAGDSPDPRYGIPVIPAWNALDLGIQHMKQRIWPNPNHHHPILVRPDGRPLSPAPHLYICRDECKATWKEMKEYRRKVSPSGRVVYIGEDHGLDTVRYVENSLIEPPKREHSDLDLYKMSGADRQAASSHRKWARSWHKQAARTGLVDTSVDSGSWY